MKPAGILTDLRVLEWGTGIAAPLAAMHLAEAGAEVIKIECESGDPARSLPGFSVWNRSKKSVVLDLENESDAATFEELLAGSDILVHDLTSIEARKRGWDPETLAARHPGLILCGIPPYPLGHADENRAGSDSLVMARAGLFDEQRGHRPGPIFIRIPLASLCSAWLAACGVIARLIARDRTGHGGNASTSLLQGALVPMTMHWARAENPSPAFTSGLPKDGISTLFECKDGVWLHLMRPAEQGPLMQREFEQMGEAEIARLDALYPGATGAPHTGANREAFKRHDSATWLADLWASDVPVQPAVPLGKIYFDEQAIENDYVVTVEDPRLGAVRQPGHAYTTTPPARIQGPAPLLGADNERVIGVSRKRQISAANGPLEAPPLAGVRVLDFGNFLAGPLAPMLLADLGAQVIKVEATSGDMMRPVARVFEGCQRGKRGIALDLKHPKSRDILERLVKQSDVVHHNLRMPAALRLGLGYEDLRKFKEDLIYSHVSSYGPRGPRKDWPGFDQLFQAQSGWEYEGAGEGNPPMWHRFGMMDHQCALASLLATLLGLRERNRTGEGQFVSASLLGASILSVSETVVLGDGSLAPFERLDSEQMGVSESHRLFICQDGWILINAKSPEGIADALGLTNLPNVALRETIEMNLQGRTCEEALRLLNQADILAEPVRLDQGDSFLINERNRENGLSVRYPHQTFGWTEQIGGLWQMHPAKLSTERSAPALGQHTDELLKELGYTPAEISSFIDEGVAVAST